MNRMSTPPNTEVCVRTSDTERIQRGKLLISLCSLFPQIEFEDPEEEATSNGYIPPDAPVPNRVDGEESGSPLGLPVGGAGWSSPGEGWDPPGAGNGWSSLGEGWAPATGWGEPGEMEGRVVDGQPHGKMPTPYERVSSRIRILFRARSLLELVGTSKKRSWQVTTSCGCIL
jgi:hypothetical protein